jgi:hypothetical protein
LIVARETPVLWRPPPRILLDARGRGGRVTDR